MAHVLAKNSRRSLAMCSEEVKRNIRIAANAKKKQELFKLLELLLQVSSCALATLSSSLPLFRPRSLRDVKYQDNADRHDEMTEKTTPY